MLDMANSKNVPGWKQRGQDGLAELDDLLRRYLLGHQVFSEDKLPQSAQDELEFRRMAILQRYRPDVFRVMFPNWGMVIDDSPAQFSVQ